MRRLKDGFTLIELLVVIAIIGILATTLAPKLREQLAKAKDAKAIALLGATRTATQVLLIDQLVTTADGTITLSGAEILKKLDSQSNTLINADGTVPVGGSRASATGDITYGGVVNLQVDTNNLTSTASISVTTDEAVVKLEKASIGEFSTEGRQWDEY